ncbi:MAG: hypothetical protein AB1698_01515 [Pseudomonadota bacterium]
MAFKFAIEKGVAIPADARDTTSSHPFEWGSMGDGDSFVIPKEYWTEERGVSEEEFKVSKLKERVRIHFRNWMSKDETRKGIMLSIREEPKGSGNLRVWITLPVVEEPPPPPPAPEKPKATRSRATAKK